MQGGSYGHVSGTVDYGFVAGNFGFYAAAEGVRDGGWRLHSDSSNERLYADAGYRFEGSEVFVRRDAAKP